MSRAAARVDIQCGSTLGSVYDNAHANIRSCESRANDLEVSANRIVSPV
jgi:hypothetical protein